MIQKAYSMIRRVLRRIFWLINPSFNYLGIALVVFFSPLYSNIEAGQIKDTPANARPFDLRACLELKITYTPVVHLGDAINFTLTLQNVCRHTIQFSLGGEPPHDVIVTTHTRVQIWRWLEKLTKSTDERFVTVILPTLEIVELEANATRQFIVEWNLLDVHGKPVRADEYLVQGTILHIGEVQMKDDKEEIIVLKTKPRLLTISP